MLEKLKLATTTAVGNAQLRAAREGKGVNDTTWPEAHYLGPLHPVLDWASDRALTALGRNQVFVDPRRRRRARPCCCWAR